ncbi:MAG: acyl-CoA dehydrogenase family protein [Oscillospiraceae bacterium]|nr:acyl-CoA dehydrogenase family protein [Oscillospiraceae bacterium]
MILSEKHKMVQKLCRQFAETEFTDTMINNLEETAEFDWEIFAKMSANGFTGIKIPVEYGGQGGDILSYCIMMEEFARVSPIMSVYATTSNSLGGGPLMFCGTEEQKRKYLIPVAKGDKIMSFGLTEPGAGSDAGGTLTTAVRDGEYFVLNGRKTFISAAPVADYAIIYARTDPKSKGSKGISMFIMDMKLEGVSLGKPESKMGIHGYPTSDIVMENVRVHESDLLGPLHKGFSTAMKTLDVGRLGIAAQGLGIAQGCFEQALKYSKERRQFGKPICKNQGISFMLADMATEIEAARQLIYHAAVMKESNAPSSPMLCSMAKLYATEMANRCAYKALQIHGGYGYIKDYAVERFYRDARITSIYEGTSQVQMMVISGALLR